MSSPINELEKLPLFRTLTGAQLNNILKHSQTSKLGKDEILFSMGEKATHFYYLKTGRIKIARSTSQGVEKVLTIVHPGQLFAEAAMFLDKRLFPATAVTLETSAVIGFQSEVFVSYLRESPELSMAMLSNLSKRLHKKVIEIENLTTQNANYRLLNFLDALIPAESKTSTEIELPGPKGAIASRLSITPETFSRALHSLSEQNLITLQGKSRRIKIPDIKIFKQYLLSQ